MKVSDFLKVFAVWLVLSIIGVTVGALGIMLYTAMWHGHNPAVPAVGFVDAVYAVGAVGLLAILASPATRN
ncbi:hypothetical protein [Streptomyces sp. NPDC046832]|uniref:hypothetical protein n=1 Tax=Streptomyces sp. NPDC046832 TaxID=3155020 RepID=UPI0033CE3C7E